MIPMKLFYQKFGGWGRPSPWRLVLCSGGAAGLAAVGDVSAAIVYSGQKNIGITSDFTGVFINVTTLQSTTAENGSWDLNPFFGGLGIANSPDFQPIRIGTGSEDPILALSLGTSVGGTATYSSNWGGSGAEDDSGHIGPGAGQFTDGQTGYLGFKLLRGTAVNYGWMRVNLTRNGDTGSILDWAYDDSGSSILIGAVADLGATPIVGSAGTEQTISANQAGTGLLMEEGAKITFNEGSAGGTYAGKIQGDGEIQITGAGGLRLAGVNTFSGTATVLEGSRLTVGEAGNLGNAQIKIGSSGSLEFDSLAANNGNANTFANAISLDGQEAILNNSGSGKVVLTGQIVSDGGLLAFTGGSFDVQGGITGTGSMRTDSAGKLTLTGTSTYTGATLVSAGTMLVNGALSGTSSVSVSSGATLGGTGSIANGVNVASGATLSPGASIESLQLGSVDLDGSLLIEWDTTVSPSIDQLNIANSLNLGSNSSVTFANLGTGTLDLNTPYIFITYGSGGLTGTFNAVNNLPVGFILDYNYGGLNQIAVVPESSSLLLTFIFSLPLLSRRRRSD